jgi:hypothetical protein
VREKEVSVIEMRLENEQLKMSIQQNLTQSQVTSQKEQDRVREMENVINKLQLKN